MAETGLIREPLPAPGEARIVWLDVLRGAALFGIAQINFPSFATGQQPVSALYGEHATLVQHLLYGTITLLVTAKFYPIFAFLFGYGHALQRQRLARRGLDMRRILMRRYAALLLFGVLHGVFLFFGDILTMYAIGGMLLLTESGRLGPGSSAALLRWGVISLVMSAVYSVSLPDFPASIHRDWVSMHGDDLALLAEGDWRSIASTRAVLYLSSQIEQLVTFLPALMLFMNAGVWACERGVLQHPELHRPLFKRCVALGLVLGLPLNLVLMLGEIRILDERAAPIALCELLDNLAFVLSLLWLGLFGLYAARHQTRPGKAVTALAALGRMALTNYLVQSLVMMAIWYLCWRQISLIRAPEAMAGLALSVCLLQMLWAMRQVRLGRQGPFEAVWRRITYAGTPASISN